MRLDYAAATDIGRRRSQNQDSMSAKPELGLFVVADGMGGHRGGEIASAIAAEVIPEKIRALQADAEWDPEPSIVQAVKHANRAIFERALKNPELQGMGTTCTTLVFKGNRLIIGHVGDSRCYYLRPGAIWQATRDHSLVAEKVRAGLITREEAKNDRMRNVITRSVGFEEVVEVETYELETRADDLFMVCSDGLSGLIEDSDILAVVEARRSERQQSRRSWAETLPEIVRELIARANAAGGDDNITCVMVHLGN